MFLVTQIKSYLSRMVVREARELEEKTEGREGKGVHKDYVLKASG